MAEPPPFDPTIGTGAPKEVPSGATLARDPALADAGFVVATFLGRYQVLGQLGAGSFGTVYKAQDEELHRQVAIKVPHRQRMATPGHADAYLAEARMLARLD